MCKLFPQVAWTQNKTFNRRIRYRYTNIAKNTFVSSHASVWAVDGKTIDLPQLVAFPVDQDRIVLFSWLHMSQNHRGLCRELFCDEIFTRGHCAWYYREGLINYQLCCNYSLLHQQFKAGASNFLYNSALYCKGPESQAKRIKLKIK